VSRITAVTAKAGCASRRSRSRESVADSAGTHALCLEAPAHSLAAGRTAGRRAGHPRPCDLVRQERPAESADWEMRKCRPTLVPRRAVYEPGRINR
jgi:hypothetical protein